MRAKASCQYERKIKELNIQCQLKTDECHEAWMSLTAANEQLEKIRMELDNKIFQTRSLGNFWARMYYFFLIQCKNNYPVCVKTFFLIESV